MGHKSLPAESRQLKTVYHGPLCRLGDNLSNKTKAYDELPCLPGVVLGYRRCKKAPLLETCKLTLVDCFFKEN